MSNTVVANSNSDKTKVVIVGGGLAGLSAAECITRLHPGQFDVTLLEARRVAGGRAGSFVDRGSGESIDYCQHVAMGCCTNLIGLLERSGQLQQWTRYSELTFLHPDAPPSRFTPSTFLPAPLHLLGALSQLRYLSSKNRRQLKHGLWRLMRTPTTELRKSLASDWLASSGQDDSTIQAFWEVILVSALGEDPRRVSMAAARKVLIDGFAAARGASDVLVPRKPLAQLFGETLVHYISELGTTVRPGQLATRLHVDASSGTVRSVETSGGDLFSADQVILATPWAATSRLIQASELADSFPLVDRWRDMPSSPITGIHLWLDREIMQNEHVAIVGMLPQWVFRRPVEAPIANGEHYYQVVISASRDVRGVETLELTQQVMSDLARVLPASAKANVLRSQVVTDPRSVFSIAPEVEATRPASATRVRGLGLAGDWIQTGWPATMEGAVISGLMAANHVLENEGLATQPIDSGLARGWLARSLIRD